MLGHIQNPDNEPGRQAFYLDVPFGLKPFHDSVSLAEINLQPSLQELVSSHPFTPHKAKCPLVELFVGHCAAGCGYRAMRSAYPCLYGLQSDRFTHDLPE